MFLYNNQNTPDIIPMDGQSICIPSQQTVDLCTLVQDTTTSPNQPKENPSSYTRSISMSSSYDSDYSAMSVTSDEDVSEKENWNQFFKEAPDVESQRREKYHPKWDIIHTDR